MATAKKPPAKGGDRSGRPTPKGKGGKPNPFAKKGGKKPAPKK